MQNLDYLSGKPNLSNSNLSKSPLLLTIILFEDNIKGGNYFKTNRTKGKIDPLSMICANLFFPSF